MEIRIALLEKENKTIRSKLTHLRTTKKGGDYGNIKKCCGENRFPDEEIPGYSDGSER
jgi:hypothetical protein